ncbi:MAG: LacI family transcriptional regulator [Opitutaceae bacterium]|nr:LacI family transcriptional regulator [Opitutaceae bacterium]
MAQMQKKPPGRATVNEIAEAAGVSIGSVSTVLNNRHVERRISLDTVEKIRAVASRLGYLPNISARRLRSGHRASQSIIIAFVTSYEAPLSFVNQFVYALRQTVADGPRAARQRSFSLTIEFFSAGQLREMPGLLTGEHFNAAIIANTTPEDDQFLARTHLPYPVVLVNRLLPGYACVIEDPTSGTRAAEVLIRAKRTRLAVIHGRPLTQTTQARLDSFVTATARGLGGAAHEIVAHTLSEGGGYEAMAKFLTQRIAIDGLYALNDSTALGAYHAIKLGKLRIPGDIAIVGVGDNEIAPFFDPPLSVVGVSRSRIGEEASRLLLRQLERKDELGSRIEIPVETILRESTGRA